MQNIKAGLKAGFNVFGAQPSPDTQIGLVSSRGQLYPRNLSRWKNRLITHLRYFQSLEL